MQDILVQIITGAIGGNVAGALLKKYNLGPLLNTVVGIVGGAGGGNLIDKLGINLGGGLVDNIAGSGVGGAILMVIVGLIKNALAKK